MEYKVCKNCPHVRIIRAQDGWEFYGCTCPPYHGKWAATIEECPIGKKDENPEELKDFPLWFL